MSNLVHASIFRTLHCCERLIWHGRPRQGIVFNDEDVLIVSVSVICIATAVFCIVSKLEWPGVEGIPVFWAALIAIAGLYMISGRFLYAAVRRAHTLYAVTDQRVLILRHFPRRSTISIPLSKIRQMSIATDADGGGRITFGELDFFNAVISNTSSLNESSRFPPQFELGEHARGVYELIRRAQRGEFSEFERTTSRAA